MYLRDNVTIKFFFPNLDPQTVLVYLNSVIKNHHAMNPKHAWELLVLLVHLRVSTTGRAAVHCQGGSL